MKARINTYAFTQTSFASDKLSVLAAIAHPVFDEGEYMGIVYQQKKQLGTFHLSVDDKVVKTQADLDLALFVSFRQKEGERLTEPDFMLRPKGYLMLHVSEGRGDFHVVLNKLGRTRPQRVFDSRSMQEEDLFVVTFLRPGQYEARDENAKRGATIMVKRPKAEKSRYIPAEPARIVVSEKGFAPARIEIGAAQAVIFSIESPKSSIAVDLKKPDDGPKPRDSRGNKVRWTNPRATE